MSDLRNISNQALRDAIGTRCNIRVVGNLQNATATVDFTVTGTAVVIQYTVDGIACLLTPTTNHAITVLAALQNPITGLNAFYAAPAAITTFMCLYVLNAAGTPYVIQGPYSGQVLTDASGKSRTVGALEALEIPKIAVPGKYCPIGVIKVVTGGTAFTVGTTNWDDNSTVASWAPICQIPATLADLVFTAGGA